jgi:ABC transport system ATP-binding/permease protein
LQVIEGLLEAYSGCVVIVSHDKAFMENVVDSMLLLDGSGPVQRFNGRYSEYLSMIDRQQAAAAEATRKEERLAAVTVSSNKAELATLSKVWCM